MLTQKAATKNDRLTVWKFTIDTEATTSGARKTAVPLHLYGQTGLEFIVDWGDSTTSSLEPSNYTEADASASVHEYSTAGKYQITLFCTDWSKARILTFNSTAATETGTTVTNCNLPRYLFQQTLVSIDNPLPAIKGKSITYNSDADTVYDGNDNDFRNLFCWCDKLKSIPAGFLDSNSSVTKFDYCFANCRNLTEIPKGLFDVHTSAAQFGQCFYNCDSLVSIPDGLFDHNALATDFSYCFMQCEALKKIPLGLFRYNTAATNMSFCFTHCLSLEHVPYDLFLYNTAVTNMQSCFCECPRLVDFKIAIGSALVNKIGIFADDVQGNALRIVCMPENSTTYSSFLGFCNAYNKVTPTHANGECLQVFEYTIDTDATTQNAKTGTIPLAVSSDASRLFIDWGDNTGAELEWWEINSTALTHEYASAGDYQITVATADWSGYALLQDSAASSSNVLIQTFRDTLKSLDSGLPPVANETIDYLFYNCTHLVSTASRIFDHLNKVRSAIGAFKNCTSLAAVSAGTLRRQWNLQNATEMFMGCTSIEYVPSGLLSQCRRLAIADRMFKDCTAIEYVPSCLYLNNIELYSRVDIFDGCSSATLPTFLSKSTAETVGVYIELYDTEAVSDGDSTVGIPFNLTSQSITLTADMGNGISLTLTSSIYAQNNSTSSVYQYDNPGLYFVSMESSDWSATRPCAWISTSDIPSPCPNSLLPLYHRQRTLIEVCTKTPFSFFQLWGYSDGDYVETLGGYTYSPAGYFSNCVNLKRVPSNLLANAKSITSNNAMFHNCISLKEIPSGLFEGCTQLAYFTACFDKCRMIQSIPAGLFDDCTSANVFYGTFQFCQSLKSIPSRLFDKCTGATRFGGCFSECHSLVSIPSGLFDHCPNVVEFASTFNDCISLQAIPAGLFDHNTACQSFYATFCYTPIASIPTGLFAHNAGCYEFDYCFQGCSSLTAIPSGLFDACTVAETFSYCFQKCTQITAVPSGLFAMNTAATTFAYCFANCSKLESIPSNVFATNTAVTNLASCFYFCIKVGDFNIHIGSSLVSNAASFVTKKTGASRTVNVPTGSTTYTTFDGLASTLGLTVVGE